MSGAFGGAARGSSVRVPHKGRTLGMIGVTHRLLSLLVVALAAGCAPTAANTSSSGQPTVPAAPKVLTIVGTEGVIGNFPGVEGGGGGHAGFVNEYLTVVDPQDEVVGRLAEETISVERGTWKLNADGTMDTIWKIRPNVKWQDGHPFTTEDLMFTYTAYKDPALPSFYAEALKLMTSAEAIDSLTFVVHWSEPYSRADLAPALDPMPKHILESLYLNDKPNFPQSTFFRQDFVGTGAYRIKQWVQGSHIEYERNELYYLGRPPLDTVILKFITDKNTVLANVLAGSLDVVYNKGALDIEAALEAKNRWAGTGNSVSFVPSQRLISIELQFRRDSARPQFGLIERDVREAMMHAIDRQAMVDATTQGLSPIADDWITPTSKLAEAARGAAPRYDYDVAKAQRMLASVGWTKGQDGILVHQTTGEKFEFDLWNRFQLLKEQAIVGDYWKAVGVNVNIKQLPIARDRHLEATLTGGQMMDQTIADFAVGRLRGSDVATPANRYNGRNLAGYSNPRFDDLLKKLSLAIDVREQSKIHADIVREAFTDLAELPFYFQVTPLLIREGFSGPQGGGAASIDWNFYTWDKKG